VSDLLT